MSDIYLKPTLEQETEYVHEVKAQDDVKKRFEDWLKSLRPVNSNPETKMKMLQQTIKSAEILKATT